MSDGQRFNRTGLQQTPQMREPWLRSTHLSVFKRAFGGISGVGLVNAMPFDSRIGLSGARA